MIKHNPNNERIKRKYLIFLKEAKRQNESSIDAVAKALSRFESYTKCRDFKAFHFEQREVDVNANLLSKWRDRFAEEAAGTRLTGDERDELSYAKNALAQNGKGNFKKSKYFAKEMR